MAKFHLVCVRICFASAHQGLMVKAYYKQNPEDPKERPQQVVLFNKWPSVELEADVVTIDLNME